MKAWGWISMRRSLEDAMNNAFEETTMKNVPIDQFWSFKRRNRVQNWNLREKLSKIGPFGTFDFWSKVNAKSQSQLVQGQSQWILVRVGSGFLGRVTGWAAELLTSSYDVSLTCTRACVSDDVSWLTCHDWRGVMMSSGDISSSVSARGRSVHVHRRVEEKSETQVACRGACNSG